MTDTVFLRRLTLKNVRSIEDLDIDFRAGKEGRKWTLLLGENGTGKSTILRAIALLMAGGEGFGDLFVSADEWVRLGKTEAILRAEVAVGAESRTVELRFRRGDVLRKAFKRNERTLNELDQLFRETPQALLTIGFGVSRRVSAAAHGERYRTARANRVATLFSPQAELYPLAAWATDVHYRFEAKGLATVNETLSDLLPGVRFAGIDRTTRQLSFQVPEGKVSFSDLSDGYQDVAGWIGDLLYRISDERIGSGSLLKARGLLLLDEMDLHLHPKWQRKLRDFLDAKLPGFQIVGTTHSPLTAHQAGAGELHVLRRANEHAPPYLYRFPGEPRTLMLHQLIMSPVFGLSTIDSAEVEAWKNEYRTLRRRSRNLSKAEQNRLTFLEDQLRDMPDWSIESDQDREQRFALERVTELLSQVQGSHQTAPAATPARSSDSPTVTARKRALDTVVRTAAAGARPQLAAGGSAKVRKSPAGVSSTGRSSASKVAATTGTTAKGTSTTRSTEKNPGSQATSRTSDTGRNSGTGRSTSAARKEGSTSPAKRGGRNTG